MYTMMAFATTIGLSSCQSVVAPAMADIDARGLVIRAQDSAPVVGATVEFWTVMDDINGEPRAFEAGPAVVTDADGRYATVAAVTTTVSPNPQIFRVIAIPPVGSLLSPDSVDTAFDPAPENFTGEPLRFEVNLVLQPQ